MTPPASRSVGTLAITGDVDAAYLQALADTRNDEMKNLIETPNLALN